MATIILGIESSCDDTSAAIIKNDTILSNVIAGQAVHEAYGGVIPELASRAHQQNIVPVVDKAIKDAGVSIKEVNAIAFTRGPGLLGSLLVGTSFAKGMAMALGIPLIEVDHLQAHVLAHFIKKPGSGAQVPGFPFLTLLVSGGNTQIILVSDYLEMKILGQTIDDAAGEAFDKCAKVMGLQYPGGPLVDKLAVYGNPNAFTFNKPRVTGLDFSFSGLKTSFLYLLRDKVREMPDFIARNLNNLCASLQHTIVAMLLEKLAEASKVTGVREIALAGGVAANSALRSGVEQLSIENGWAIHLPPLEFTTDNAAMVAITGYYKFLKNEFAQQEIAPYARVKY